MTVVMMQVFLFERYSENTIGDWWKHGIVVFIGFLIKNAHLPSYNTMSLMFNAFIASSLCPYNKHNGTANFFDKSFKVKLYSKLLR